MEEMEIIADKIRKLMASGESKKATNEVEAQIFLDKAQSLLEQHGLSLLELEKMGKKQDHSRSDSRLTGGLYKWQRVLWKDVAETNYCMYWSIKGLTKGSKYEHRVLGSKLNALVVRQLAEYLQEAVERITRERFENNPNLYFSSAANAYREGMADRLARRLRDRMWQRKQEADKAKAADSTALTVADVEDAEYWANQDYMYGWAPGTAAKNAAEQKIRSAKWYAEYQAKEAAKKAADELFKKTDPEGWAKEQARKKAEQDKQDKKYGSFRYRIRSTKPKDPAYYEGYDKAQDISLDRQVDRKKKGEIE